VIIGAGPTGLSMASQLIRHGIDFIILEKNAGPTPLSKAVVVQARTLEIFRELGIADEALRRGRMTTRMQLYRNGKRKLAVDLSGLGTGLSEFPFALSLEQSKTEKLLHEYVQQHGKDVRWSSQLTGFTQNDSGVTVRYEEASGTEHTIAAQYLVGCDGAGSLVRHGLGLQFEGSTEPKLFYVADVVIDSPVICEDTLYMYMIPKGFALFFPMEGDHHYRMIGMLPDAGEEAHEYAFSEIEQTIGPQLGSPVTFKELRWFSTYRIHSRKATAFRKGRCFIAGDAGHIHTPAGGQGMNTGIQDAYNLAWKLACVIRGEAGDLLLQTYDSERTGNAKHLLRTTDRMFDIMSGAKPLWRVLRGVVFALILRIVSKSNRVRKRIFPLLGQIGIAYPDSLLSVKSAIGTVKAGDRMPYFTFANGRIVFSYLEAPVFKLLYFGDGNPENPLTGGKIQPEFKAFNEVPAVFGKETNFYVLLRPDNHVSYIGKDPEQCRQLLERIR
jgi:2-polyprenyl-6-methoxyphenol hydroxylase-like FAD-dependent oxidoreductase